MRPTIYSLRGVLVSLPIVLVLLHPEPWAADRHPLSASGLILVALGFCLRLWAQQHLHYRIHAPMALTVSGPYTLIRNPLYVGNILIFTGTMMTSGRAWLTLATLVWLSAVYTLVVRFEEARLTRRYGAAYVRYQASVPRWLPRASTGRPLEFLNQHLASSAAAELLWFGLPLLVLGRRVF